MIRRELGLGQMELAELELGESSAPGWASLLRQVGRRIVIRRELRLGQVGLGEPELGESSAPG